MVMVTVTMSLAPTVIIGTEANASQALFHLNPSNPGDEVDTTHVPILQTSNWGSQRLRNPPKVSKLKRKESTPAGLGCLLSLALCCPAWPRWLSAVSPRCTLESPGSLDHYLGQGSALQESAAR